MENLRANTFNARFMQHFQYKIYATLSMDKIGDQVITILRQGHWRNKPSQATYRKHDQWQHDTGTICKRSNPTYQEAIWRNFHLDISHVAFSKQYGGNLPLSLTYIYIYINTYVRTRDHNTDFLLFRKSN